MPKRAIVLMGQSNGFAGYAEDRVDAFRTHPNLYQYKQDRTFVVAQQPMDFQSIGNPNRKLVAYAYYMARDYLIPRFPGVDFCILPQSVGGSGFHGYWHAPHPPDYATGGVYYETTIAQMNAFLAAEAGNTIDCVILQNGEADVGDLGSQLGYYAPSYGLTDYQAYTRYVTEMIADMTARVTGGRTWPFLIGQPPPDVGYPPSVVGDPADGPPNDHHNSAYAPIFDAIKDIPNVVSNCAYLDSLYPSKLMCHDGTKSDGNGDVIIDSGNFWLHYNQASHHVMAQRAFKQYMRLRGYGSAITVKYGVAGGVVTSSPNVWMEAPDVITLRVDDPPVIKGNIASGDYSSKTYGVWSQNTNPLTGNLEWGAPVGLTKNEMRFSDKVDPTPPYDKMKLRTLANYTISGGGSVTITNVYYRDETYDQGFSHSSSGGGINCHITPQRHTVYLKLSAVPTQNSPIIINNTAAGVGPLTLNFNDKTTRAGGIQVNHVGQRPDDAFKYAYLAVRFPKGPNNGTVNFMAAPYNFTNFQVLDSNKTSVFSGPIVQRCGAGAAAGEGFDAGIDVADLAQGWAITDISKAAQALVTAPGHTLVANDKVRFFGINGMTQLEDPPAIFGNLWTGVSVILPITANSFTINLNTTGFGTFTNTTLLNEALGGVNNKVFKCFNTNRAGTYVFGMDFSTFVPTTGGTFYIYIPGYGISDPFLLKSDAWAQAAGQIHSGWYSQRLSDAVTNPSGYSRGVALRDGTNGVTNYRSTLPARLSHESAYAIKPTGVANYIGTHLGAFADVGTLTLTSITTTGTTATATCSAPIPGVTVGQTIAVQVQDTVPAGYTQGIGSPAIVASATTFTYTVASGLAAATTPGYARTGFVTNVRQPGRVGPQDAGDCDEPGTDHFPGWKFFAMVFRACPKPGRVTPYAVPLSSSVLGSLYAGTDAAPPVFHELFYYGDVYRVNQMPDGSVWGGHNIGAIKSDNTFGSMIAPYPESIDKYRGTDAGGPLTGQKVHAFIYARDHVTTFLYACFAAQLAGIAYDYGYTTLGDTYKASAISAYAWSDGMFKDPAVNDAYYKGVLNLRTKCGWTETQYQDLMRQFNGNFVGGVYAAWAFMAKADAAGALFRLLGGTGGTGTPYGNVFTHSYCSAVTIVNGGAGHAVNDIVTLTGNAGMVNPIRVLVTAVSAGVITTAIIMNQGQFASPFPGNPNAQTSTTGTGTGATFNCTYLVAYAQLSGQTNAPVGCYEYSMGVGANAAAVDYMQTHPANTQPAFGMSATIPYQGMYIGAATTAGGSQPIGPVAQVCSHLADAQRNGVTAAKSSPYLKLMQAGLSWIFGSNFKNKAYITGMGPRPFVNLLHEDSFKLAKPPPFGINPVGYWGYSTSAGMGSSFGGSLSGTAGLDNTSYAITDNCSGQFETGVAYNGSWRMHYPWRGASGYWEWSPEHRYIIYISEFTQLSNLQLWAMTLYVSGWDGNA